VPVVRAAGVSNAGGAFGKTGGLADNAFRAQS
jgi:hypothetical protein